MHNSMEASESVALFGSMERSGERRAKCCTTLMMQVQHTHRIIAPVGVLHHSSDQCRQGILHYLMQTSKAVAPFCGYAGMTIAQLDR